MKKIILSIALALCLCISSPSVAGAWQEDLSLQVDILTGKSISAPVTRDSTVPTPTEIYQAMIALKDQDAYKEGTIWTDDEPYSDAAGYYHWKGGPLDGTNISAVGCVAFAFILSDQAFGSLPARMYAAGGFTYEDIKVGDILRINGDTHTVIVLEASDFGVVIAEGNISTGDHKGRIHWGRTISKENVMRDTSHYITRYPSGYIPPDDPGANESIASGTLEGGLTWNLTKAGTLTISGQGAMPNFESNAAQPWNEKSSQIRKVVIGDGVTSIGSCAFWNCGVLGVEISSSVTTIGNSAFRGSSIVSINIPSNVKIVGDSAFRQCKNLSAVTVSDGVETISQNAFSACTSLTSIDLPASIGEVGPAAFMQCTALTSATFAPGSKQVKLGDNLFTQCYYLMRVTLPKSIDRIGEGVFQNCLMLAGLEIPQGAESIGQFAFASCNRFTTVIIPDSVTSIGISAFASCSLKDIYFTGTKEQWDRISKIGDTASAVSKATIHYNYTPSVDPGPDDGDNSENNGNTGTGDNSENNGNTGTGDNSENNGNTGTGDNSENSGNTGTGGNSENNGNAGTGGNSETGGNTGTGGNSETGDSQEPTPLAKGKIFVVSNSTYKVTKVGEEVELKTSKSTAKVVTINTVIGTDGVKYKVTSIGAKAMQNNKKMTSLVIGDHVKSIGANAFAGCQKLTTVTFGKSVAVIGTNSFKGCAALKKTLTLPDSVKTIGASAFSGCKKITAVTIGKTSKSNLTTIGKSAFNGCKKLGKVTIKSKKLSSVGKQSFKGTKSSLKVKVLSDQLKKYKNIFKKAGLKVNQVIK